MTIAACALFASCDNQVQAEAIEFRWVADSPSNCETCKTVYLGSPGIFGREFQVRDSADFVLEPNGIESMEVRRGKLGSVETWRVLLVLTRDSVEAMRVVADENAASDENAVLAFSAGKPFSVVSQRELLRGFLFLGPFETERDAMDLRESRFDSLSPEMVLSPEAQNLVNRIDEALNEAEKAASEGDSVLEALEAQGAAGAQNTP